MTTKIIINEQKTSALFIQDISTNGTVKLIAEIPGQADLQSRVEMSFSPKEIREAAEAMMAAAELAEAAVTHLKPINPTTSK